MNNEIKPSKEEAEQDLQWSYQDRHNLKQIIDNLDDFINTPRGEDRSYYKLQLENFKSLAHACDRIILIKIEQYLKSSYQRVLNKGPRYYPCPDCGRENALTVEEKRRGYYCGICTRNVETGMDGE